MIVEQARVRAAEKGVDGLAVRARTAHLRRGDDRRRFGDAASRFLRGLVDARVRSSARPRGKFDNTAVMAKILALRHEAARLLDFPNYAAYALATRMAPSNQAVFDFLRQLVQRRRARRRKREFAELEQFAGRKLNAWDVGYYAEKLQAEAVLDLAGRAAPVLPAATRARRAVRGGREAVRREDRRTARRAGVSPGRALLRNRRRQGAVRAGFYLDACARPKKRAGAWMDDCVGRKDFGAEHTVPVAYLVCNFLPAAPGKPALLTHDDVVTMFHEFGHGLHHMLTRVGYPSIAGINGVSWDAVELPSQFMENFAWRPEVLARWRGTTRPASRCRPRQQAQLLGSRTFHAGLASDAAARIRAVRFPPARRVRPGAGARASPRSSHEVRAEVGVFAVPEWNRFPHNFGHIFAGGYAAGYYSYKWAEVLAADAFAAFEEQGVFDRSGRAALPRFHPVAGRQPGRRSTRSSSFAAGRRM